MAGSSRPCRDRRATLHRGEDWPSPASRASRSRNNSSATATRASSPTSPASPCMTSLSRRLAASCFSASLSEWNDRRRSATALVMYGNSQEDSSSVRQNRHLAKGLPVARTPAISGSRPVVMHPVRKPSYPLVQENQPGQARRSSSACRWRRSGDKSSAMARCSAWLRHPCNSLDRDAH